MKLLGIVQNIARAKRAVSASQALLAKELVARDRIVSIIDCDISVIAKRLIRLKAFHPDLHVWALRNSLALESRLARSRVLRTRLQSVLCDFDAVLQVGVEFGLTRDDLPNGVRRFSYHDDNVVRFFESRTRNMVSGHRRWVLPRYQRILQFERQQYEEIDSIFCMSAYLRRVFIESFQLSPDKVFDIGFGANWPRGVPDVSLQERKWDRPSLVFVSKDSFDEKGGKLVVEAFRFVKSRFSNAQLTLVGTAPSTLPNGVRAVGFIDRRTLAGEQLHREIMLDATTFVMPSFVEAAGSAFVEAMHFGCPVIGARQGSTTEIVEGSGAGRVLSVADGRILADLIIEMHESPDSLRLMSTCGYSAARTRYSWDAVVRRFDEACNGVFSL